MTSALAGMVLLALTGCAPAMEQPDLAILDRAAASGDAVPASVDLKGKDPASIRLAVDHGGFRFYLARPADEPGFCLIQVADGAAGRSGSACNTGGGPVLTANLLGFGSEAAVVADGANVDDLVAQGYARIQDNILVRR